MFDSEKYQAEIWKNNKTGTEYICHGCCLNTTNRNDGTVMVMYEDRIKCDILFVRSETEFLSKFTVVPE